VFFCQVFDAFLLIVFLFSAENCDSWGYSVGAVYIGRENMLSKIREPTKYRLFSVVIVYFWRYLPTESILLKIRSIFWETITVVSGFFGRWNVSYFWRFFVTTEIWIIFIGFWVRCCQKNSTKSNWTYFLWFFGLKQPKSSPPKIIGAYFRWTKSKPPKIVQVYFRGVFPSHWK
jgi:hypothetical protein